MQLLFLLLLLAYIYFEGKQIEEETGLVLRAGVLIHTLISRSIPIAILRLQF